MLGAFRAFAACSWSTAQSADGLPTFTLYNSKSFDLLGVTITQPDGASKLCLGCHDGSYAVFAYIPDTEAIFEPGDLENSHPISFVYDDTLAGNVPLNGLKVPSVALSGLTTGGTIQDDLLDENDKMQCTSCHDPHTTGLGEYLLRYEYDDNDEVICRVCHNK